MIWSLATIDQFDDRIDQFWDEASRPFDFIGVRNQEYLNWRYRDIRAGRFTARIAEQDDRILGYVISKQDGDRGYIVDVLALPGRIDVVRSLIEDRLRSFREDDASGVMCWMVAHHPYNGVLRRLGFFDSRRDSGFAYRPLGIDASALEFLSDPDARLHITHGDATLV